MTDPSPPTPRGPALPPRYEVGDGEVLADAKQLASDVVTVLTTYDPGETPAAVAGRVGEPAAVDHLIAAAAPLHHDGAWSRGEVVYPQMGGVSDDRASVMVVVSQTIRFADGTVVAHTRTLDVRMTKVDDRWEFERLASAGGVPVERPDDLPDVAAAVVDDERIELADTAVWDIYRGRIAPELLAFMSRIAELTPYAVTVLDTGHPWEVFGTDRQSKHTMGYAVDLRQVGGHRVINEREEGSIVHALVTWIHGRPELSEIGGPWALDGHGGSSFTDIVHQDHLHIAVPVLANPE